MSAMPGTLTTLLCLGLYLSQRAGAQEETLPKPLIWSRPPFMVPRGSQATIWCQGTHEAVEYQLQFDGRFSASERPNSPAMRNKARFHVPAMTPHTAGQYRCFYRGAGPWSQLSDPLDLVLTGMYDTPTLSVHPGPVVAVGEEATFYCHLEATTNTFFLLKKERASRSQRKSGDTAASFPLGPVTRAHGGTYRCFGSYSSHVWSFPSAPVKLLVSGEAGNSSLAPPELASSPDSWDPYLLTTETSFQKGMAFWDHTAQNLLRISLALLVLVALVCLLAEDWLSQKRTQDGPHRVSSQGCQRRLRAQGGPWAEHPEML